MFNKLQYIAKTKEKYLKNLIVITTRTKIILYLNVVITFDELD